MSSPRWWGSWQNRNALVVNGFVLSRSNRLISLRRLAFAAFACAFLHALCLVLPCSYASAQVSLSRPGFPPSQNLSNAPYPDNTAPVQNLPSGVNPGQTTYDPNSRLPANADEYTRRIRQIEDAQRRNRTTGVDDQPTEFQKLVTVSTGVRLPIFGASLFNSVPSTFAPVENIPVTPDYVIGPGDELRIQVYGQINRQGYFIVDRTGDISFPEVGTIHAAGVKYAQLQAFLKSQFSRVYRNFDLNVSLGQLRTTQVFVVGAARSPGSYTVGSLSTLLNALFISGGPLPQGSLRDIQLLRNNAPVVHFDLYDLLLRGDKSKDLPLLPGDVIFIPTVGPQAALVGSVNNPAIYEIRPGTTVNQLLGLAGGTTSVAIGERIRVERIFEHSMRNLIDVNPAKKEDPVLAGGDIITVGAILDRYQDSVTLRGNVAFPGRYVWHQGMRVSDLVPNRDQLITRDYYTRRNALGSPLPDYSSTAGLHPTGSYGNNGSGTNGYGNGAYGNGPYGNGASGNGPYGNGVYGNGANGNYANGAYGNGNNPDGTSPNNSVPNGNSYPYPNYGAPNGNYPNGNPSGFGSPQARNQDPSRDGSNPGQTSSAGSSTAGGGSVADATIGSSNLFPVVNDVLLSAPDLDWSYAVIERLDAHNLTTSLISFNPGRLFLNADQSQNLELQSGDVVTFFSTADLKVPSSQQTRFVRLEGEFIASGVYSVEPGETLRHLLTRAGGFTSDAYLYGSEFTRLSTRRVQQQRLNEYADNLESQVSVFAASGNARAVSDRDAAATQAAALNAKESIARLRRVVPLGRIVLELKPDSRGVDTIPDLPLEDGDRFVVPRLPSTVNVEGQVYSANAFVFERGRREHDYLRQAGGPDREADRKRAFILRADGSVFSSQYGNVSHATIFPGDTIVVPPQLDRRAILRNLLDVSSVISQFGIGVAAIRLLR